MAQVVWLDSSKSAILLTKETGETLQIKNGDFISTSAFPDGIKIESFIWNPDRTDPIAISYTQWMKDQQYWGRVAWDITGSSNLDWSTFQLINNGVCPEIYIAPMSYSNEVPPDTTVAPDTTVVPDTNVEIDTTVEPDAPVAPDAES